MTCLQRQFGTVWVDLREYFLCPAGIELLAIKLTQMFVG
jgi:hypothetical protein